MHMNENDLESSSVVIARNAMTHILCLNKFLFSYLVSHQIHKRLQYIVLVYFSIDLTTAAL